MFLLLSGLVAELISFIKASYSARITKNNKKQIGVMNKVPPQAPEGDVKSGKRELLHFEVDGLGDCSNLHPLQGLGAISFIKV